MNLKLLEDNVRGFTSPDYGRVVRDGAAYVATERFVRRGLRVCLYAYRKLERLDQTARLLRDAIDFLLRRYHGYAIKERIRAHYRDADLKPGEKADFEHVIPAATLAALLIQDLISVELAMNPPTCLLKKKHHSLLHKQGLANRTPDVWDFWQRYSMLGIRLETHDGTVIDPKTWNLGTHVTYFKIGA
jgi:hypothetical protein